MRVVAAALVLICGGAAPSGAALAVSGPDVTVFIAGARAPGAPAGEQQALDEAARELREAVRKKRGLRIVDSADRADVRVEVTGRDLRDLGEGGFGGMKVTPLDERTIKFHVTAWDAEGDIKGVGQASWGRAAKDGADRLLKWIARHEPKR